MNDRRTAQRISLDLDAQYIVGDSKKESCKLVNIGRTGTGIVLYAQKKLQVDTQVTLAIDFPSRLEPIMADVLLIWVKELDGQENFHFVAGGMLTVQNPEDRLLLVDYAANCKELADHTPGTWLQ